MKTSPSHGRMAGFTVTELVMVMTIIGVLAAIGIPSFKYVTVSNRISSEINGLLGDMQFARSQAIKQGLTVTVCSSSDGATCNTGPAGNTWSTGWIVFLDSNSNQQVDAGEQVIRVQPPFGGTDTLISSVSYAAATYNRMGYAPTYTGTTININLHDSSNTTAWTRCLAITASGSVSTEKYGMGTPACN
jgi:type IV fimbrial biogenesis protein FimT